MRRSALALTMIMALAGCTSSPAGPTDNGTNMPSPPPTHSTPSSPEPPLREPSSPPTVADSADAPSAEVGVHAVEDGLKLTGLENAGSFVWSPSGRTAVVKAKSGWYLLNTEGPSLERLPAFDPLGAPVFWSESDLLWMEGGRLLRLRNLATGDDRLLHDFGTQVVHFLRPEETRYVVNRARGLVQQGYRFGTIVTGELGGQDETVLLKTGHLIGRMASGPVLAVEGYRGGPLWALASTGEKRLLSEEDAYFVQVSPDGRRALWLTGSPRESSWWDLFKPAVAYADPPYDPPLTDLWTWNGVDDPVRIALGGTFSARAAFSPDGTYIALALNENLMTDSFNPPTDDKPGHLAVVEGREIRRLVTFAGRVSLGIWLGSDGFQFSPPAGKTGAQAPIFRIDLTGEQTIFSGGIWYWAGNREGRALIVNWQGDVTTVHWSDSTREARIEFDPNEHLGDPWYVPSSSPYLPFVRGERVALRRLLE